jgi:uncharacterized protein YggE
MADSSTLTLRPPVWALIVAVIIGGCFYIYGKQLELRAPAVQPVIISVSADAKVSASPDIGLLSFGVQTGRQSTAKQAIDLLKKEMTAVIEATKKQGIEDKDITTDSFSLYPAFDYQDGRQIPRGFEARESLTVKVRDLDKTGDVLTAVTAAGANQVGDVTFSIDNPDQIRAQARTKAIEKAKAKALDLASSLGMSLGRMTGFNEDGYAPPRAMMLQ